MTHEEKFLLREHRKEGVWKMALEKPCTLTELCREFSFGKTSSRAVIDKMVREGYLTKKRAEGSTNLYSSVKDKPYKARKEGEFVSEFAFKHRNPYKTYGEFGGIIITDKDNPNKKTYINLEKPKTAHAPRPKRKVNVWIGTSMGAIGEASDY